MLDRLQARLLGCTDESERTRLRSQAAEAAQPQIREGKLLLARFNMPGVSGVLRDIEQIYARVLKMTDGEVSSDDEEVLSVHRETEKVQLLTNCKRSFWRAMSGDS